jgi:hypothetical protein
MLIVHCRVFINWVIILEKKFEYLIFSTNLVLGQMNKINKFKMRYDFLTLNFKYFSTPISSKIFNQNLLVGKKLKILM